MKWDKSQMSQAAKNQLAKKDEKIRSENKRIYEQHQQEQEQNARYDLKPVHGWTFDEIFRWLKIPRTKHGTLEGLFKR